LLLVPVGAAAQIAPDDYTLVGAAVRSRPAYDGSESQRTDVVPVLRHYGRPWFARTTQGVLEGGARWPVTSRLQFGAQIAYEEGRSRSESSLLRTLNLEDVDPGVSAGVHLELDSTMGRVPVSLLGRWRQHADFDRGWQADLRFSVGLYGGGGTIVAAFAQGTWASAKSVETFYALPNADAGLLHASIGLIGSHDLSTHWTAVASVQARELRGDARLSPIVERKSSLYASAGIAYRF
jgi:outer membrane scaffolding protein for murein synthesis (MipA/OmpV family)